MASRLRRLGNLNEYPSGSLMVRSAWSKEMHTWGWGGEGTLKEEPGFLSPSWPAAHGPPRALDNSPASGPRLLRLAGGLVHTGLDTAGEGRQGTGEGESRQGGT